MRVVTASEMQEMDRATIREVGIPGAVLMENAARGATRVFLEHFAPKKGSRILVICGRGNNGGDGYVMARYLQERGMRVWVVILSEFEKISGDALINLNVIRNMDLDIREVVDSDQWATCGDILSGAEIIIDGILGTGLNSRVRGFYSQVIDDVNGLNKPVMAVDIPSGLNSDTGQVMGTAIKADLTVTFGYPKLGQVVFPGAGIVGRLVRIDIGIPKSVGDDLPGKYAVLEPEDFRPLLIENQPHIHKGDRGHLLILAGSTGKTGAAALTARGALRAGAGLVTVGVPRGLNPVLEIKLTEAMTEPLAETPEGSLSLKAFAKIKKLMAGKTALAIGPGLSTHRETVDLVRKIVRECDLPIIVDADGLNALAGDLSVLQGSAERMVLTPHPGEMGRLSGLENAEVQEDRVAAAERFVKDHGCYLLLKGARTLLAQPDGKVHVNPTGNPALSAGGSGDVLTGLIGGFLARGSSPQVAAMGGAYIHGLAADLLSEKMGQTGIYAGELLGIVPEIMSCLGKGDWPLGKPPIHKDFYQTL